MTTEQQNLIDSLRQQAASAYDKMDEQQVDYDKFKQVADGSALKADQAQKVYDRLYKTFIYYPSFIKSLGKIRDDAKVVSDKYQEILREKYNSFIDYKYEYENIISKINQNLLKINAEELAYDIQDIVDNQDSLTYSYELVDAADNYAMQKAQAQINKDILTGREACFDKNGIEIEMRICKPSTASGATGIGGISEYVPSAADIVGKKIDDWINVISVAVNSDNINDLINVEKATSQDIKRKAEAIAAAKAAQIAAEKAAAEKAAAEKANLEKIQAEQKAIIEAEEKAAAEKKKQELNAIVNQFSFNVDISKITEDKKLADKTAPSPRQQNINYALCNAMKVSKIVENYITIGNTINDWTNFNSGLIGTTMSYVTNVNTAKASYLKVGNKVRIFNIYYAQSKDIYIEGLVAETYNPADWGGILKIKVTKVVGEGIFNGFELQVLNSIDESLKFIINNPSSTYNGAVLTDYLNDISATSDETSIARASCPTSDYSSDYYKKLDSNKIGFDGSENSKKNQLSPLYFIIGGVSLFFIVKSILKKNK
jgi:hypothetical protein